MWAVTRHPLSSVADEKTTVCLSCQPWRNLARGQTPRPPCQSHTHMIRHANPVLCPKATAVVWGHERQPCPMFTLNLNKKKPTEPSVNVCVCVYEKQRHPLVIQCNVNETCARRKLSKRVFSWHRWIWVFGATVCLMLGILPSFSVFLFFYGSIKKMV